MTESAPSGPRATSSEVHREGEAVELLLLGVRDALVLRRLLVRPLFSAALASLLLRLGLARRRATTAGLGDLTRRRVLVHSVEVALHVARHLRTESLGRLVVRHIVLGKPLLVRRQRVHGYARGDGLRLTAHEARRETQSLE